MARIIPRGEYKIIKYNKRQPIVFNIAGLTYTLTSYLNLSSSFLYRDYNRALITPVPTLKDFLIKLNKLVTVVRFNSREEYKEWVKLFRMENFRFNINQINIRG